MESDKSIEPNLLPISTIGLAVTRLSMPQASNPADETHDPVSTYSLALWEPLGIHLLAV